MFRSIRHRQYYSRRRESGIATILIVVLVGVAVTAIAMTMMLSTRSAQEKQVAVHAAAHAQNSLWMGVESFRRYLDQISDSDIDALHNIGDLPIQVASNYGTITVKDISVSTVNGNKQVKATITASHGDAKATSSLQLVFEKGSGGGGTVELSASLDFHDTLDVRGEIIFNTPAGTRANVNVDGDVYIQNVSVTPLGRLQSTGSVSLNSGVTVDELRANGDVLVDQSAKVGKLTTMGSVTGSGNGYISYADVNGSINVSLSGLDGLGYTSHALNAIDYISLGSGTHKLVKTGSTLTLGQVQKVEDGQSVGNATINNGATVITSLITQGDVTCPGNWWVNLSLIEANGGQTDCPPAVVTSKTPPNSVTVMSPVTPYAMSEFIVDVWPLKNKANYVVEYDSTEQAIKITVQNVSGIANGVYYIGSYSSKKSYLCTAPPTNQGNCSSTSITDHAFCIGDTITNTCLSYAKNKAQWTIDGTAMAPGIMWFDGDVEISTTFGYATILSTGDITTSGNLKLRSANYGGYDPVCNGVAAEIPEDSYQRRTYYQQLFQDQYPTNLCDKTSPKYLPIALGNIALAAGGYDPNGNTSYSGGNIDLDQSNELFGSVLSGAILSTAGNSTVHGYISAAALNEAEKQNRDNQLQGTTTIDLSSVPDSYSPTTVPDMGNTCQQNCSSNGSSSTKVLWSRYL